MEEKLLAMAAKQNVCAAVLLLAGRYDLFIPDRVQDDLQEMEPTWITMEESERSIWLAGFVSCLRIMGAPEQTIESSMEAAFAEEFGSDD